MKNAGICLLALLCVLVAAGSSTAATNPPKLSASVLGPPEVQRAGNSYLVTITTRNPGGWVPRFCIDFGDDNNSWKIVMPGMKAYDNDTFCYGTLRGHKKQFIARIIAAKTGEKKLEVCLGTAKYYNDLNRALLGDDQLCWNDSIVIA